MRIYKAIVVVAAAQVALLLVACAPEGSCIRFSDCAKGFVCSDGQCVKPGEGALVSEPTEDGDASADAAPVKAADAGRDAKADAKSDAASDAGATPQSDASSTPVNDAAPDA